MKRRIYLYHPELPPEMVPLLESLSENIHLERKESNLMVLFDADYYNEEPLDMEEFLLLLMEDFEMNFTLYLEPYSEEDFLLSNDIIPFLSELPPKLYYLDDIITYAVLRHNEPLKEAIKAYVLSKANADVIHTVREFIENNMNSSVSAKKLYMHRNTLNYRIDNFIEATHINVKTFKGATAIYMLYKY